MNRHGKVGKAKVNNRKAMGASFINKYSGGGKNNLALAMKQEKIEKQRNLKSAALREYAKLCKREGIESERVNLGPREEAGDRDEENHKIRRDKKKKKSANPFMKEMRQAETLAADRAEVERSKLSKDEEREQKLRERQQKQKDRMKRTKKGQPLMDDAVKRLLSSIQKSS